MLETEIALWKPPTSLASEADELTTLRAVPLFKELRDSDLRRIMRLLHERQFEPGEVVFREGQTGAGMYIVQRGEVDIVMRLEDGSERFVLTLRDGDFFGELALLEALPRSATSVVRKPTVVLGIFQSDLEQLLDRNSRLGARVVWNLARVIGFRLRDLSGQMRAQAAAARAAAKAEQAKQAEGAKEASPPPPGETLQREPS